VHLGAIRFRGSLGGPLGSALCPVTTDRVDRLARIGVARRGPVNRCRRAAPAGVAKMPFWRFGILTVLGSIPWVLALALVGRSVGDNWEEWRHRLGYLDYVILAAVVVGVVYWIVKRRRGGSDPDQDGPGFAAEAGGTSNV
jgi:4-amino-4-deoxy-L-arabinose transferase-like glycosyltransferase